MIQAQPKTKFAELLELLIDLNNSESVEPGTYAYVEFEARKLLKVEPYQTYILLGVLELCRGNIALMHKHHDNAVKISGRHPEALFNYAVSLMKIGDDSAALSLAEEANDNETSIYLVEFILSLCKKIGDIGKFNSYNEKYTKLVGERDMEAQLDAFDLLMSNNPDLISRPDQALVQLVEDLIDGVEVQ